MPEVKTLDIIVPCYNPRPGWIHSIEKSMGEIKADLPPHAFQSLILVNDGSTSGITEREIDELGLKLPELKVIEYQKNKGKGHAVRTGVRSSDADIQIYTDIDFPYENTAVVDFYNSLAANTPDIVVASRGNTYYNSLSSFRKVLSKTLKWLNGHLFRLSTSDTQGGLKGFGKKGKKIFLTTTISRYLFDLEFIQKATKENLIIEAIEVKLKPDIVLPSPSPTILVKELHNFIRLLIWR